MPKDFGTGPKRCCWTPILIIIQRPKALIKEDFMAVYLFSTFVAFIAIQRVYELFLSKRHERAILAQGGKEHASEHFLVMKLVHSTWLLAMLLEVFMLKRSFSYYIFVPALLLTLAGQFLRYAAITTLKERWTVRIMTIKNAPPVDHGIFRYIRHPNYLGVVLEIFAIPLLHQAYLTSLIFSLANGLLLWVRIGEEEKALARENNYDQYFSINYKILK